MRTFADHIYDIKKIARPLITDDTLLDSGFIGKLFNDYRAAMVKERYADGMLDPNPDLFQNYGALDFNKITGSEDPSLTDKGECFGVARLPNVIYLRKDASIRLFASSMATQVYNTTLSELNMMINTSDCTLSQ